MPPFGPIKRSDLVFFLRRLGYAGPSSGGKHQYMVKGEQKVLLPNPHRGDVGRALLGLLLRKAEISREDWEKL